MSAYLNFVFRTHPTHTIPIGIEIVPNFWSQIAFWLTFFVSIFFGASFLLKTLWPKWYNDLPDRKKREFPSYIICTVHHMYVVPIGYTHIFQDFFRTAEELSVVNYSQIEAPLISFMMSYLIADTVCYALPEFFRKGSFEFLLHHLASIWLGYACMIANGHVLRCTPHLIICESANLFFNYAWFLRAMGDQYRDLPIVSYCEITFAILFFFTRVVNLPLILFQTYASPYGDTLGYSKYTFFPIVALQYFWFYKIVASLLTRSGPKDKKDKANTMSEKEKTT
jgi:hypothetical protein